MPQARDQFLRSYLLRNLTFVPYIFKVIIYICYGIYIMPFIKNKAWIDCHIRTRGVINYIDYVRRLRAYVRGYGTSQVLTKSH